MADLYGDGQAKIIQDLIKRVEKLESAQRVKPGLKIDIPPPPTAPDIGGMSGLSTPTNWPDTYSDVVAENVTVDLQMIRLYALSIRSALLSAGIFV